MCCVWDDHLHSPGTGFVSWPLWSASLFRLYPCPYPSTFHLFCHPSSHPFRLFLPFRPFHLYRPCRLCLLLLPCLWFSSLFPFSVSLPLVEASVSEDCRCSMRSLNEIVPRSIKISKTIYCHYLVTCSVHLQNWNSRILTLKQEAEDV